MLVYGINDDSKVKEKYDFFETVGIKTVEYVEKKLTKILETMEEKSTSNDNDKQFIQDCKEHEKWQTHYVNMRKSVVMDITDKGYHYKYREEF